MMLQSMVEDKEKEISSSYKHSIYEALTRTLGILLRVLYGAFACEAGECLVKMGRLGRKPTSNVTIATGIIVVA